MDATSASQPAKKGAIVTGAASGIGLATARILGSKGHVVLFADRDEKRGRARAEACGQLFHYVDVSDEASVVALVDHAKEALPNISYLVNCAGCAFFHSWEECPTSMFDRAMQVNLRSVFLMCREALPALKETHGSVVNVASVHASFSWQGFGPYAASKGGIVSMTKQMAGDFSRYGIRVNSVSPGQVKTAIAQNSSTYEGMPSLGSDVDVDGFDEGDRADPAEQELLTTLSPEAVGEAIAAILDLRGVTGQDLVVDAGVSSIGVSDWHPIQTYRSKSFFGGSPTSSQPLCD